MNAHTPTPPAPVLTALAVTAEPVLRAILAAAAEPHDTLTALAEAAGRDVRNINKALESLQGEGLITWADGAPTHRPVLTPAGAAALAALDRAAGRPAAGPVLSNPPPGGVTLRWVDIQPNPANPRTRSGLLDLDIEEMAASIRASLDGGGQGILQPVTVRPPLADGGPWRLLIGHRRHAGWRLAAERGWIDADHAFPCLVFDGDDIAARKAALVENIQRADLDDLEAAEDLLAIAEAENLTPTQVAGEIGKTGPSGERWVQERIKVALEADPADKARYVESQRRIAERGSTVRTDPDAFTWTQLRDSVKTPRHVTALEKTPRLRLLLLEMAFIAEVDGETDSWVPIAFHPPGGVLDIAHELDLIERGDFKPGRAPAARLRPRAIDWLIAQGWYPDVEDGPDPAQGILDAARIDALGPMGAASLPQGMAATDFLNPPAPPSGASEGEPSAPEPEPGSAHPSPPPPPPTQGGETLPEAGPSPASGGDLADDDDSDPLPDHLLRLAGVSAPAAPAPEPAREPAPQTLTPRQHLILVEVAHKISTAGETTRGGAIRGATADGFNTDPVASSLMPGWISFAQRQTGVGFLVTLTTAACERLAATHPDGVDIGDVFDAQAHAGVTDAGSSYATAWLNPPSPEDRASEDGPNGAGAPPEPEPESAPAPPATAPADLNPVRLMREALTGLWLTAGAAFDAINAVLAADDEDATAAATLALADPAAALQRALFTAAEYVPAAAKAGLETDDHE
ncbi:MAG: ParB N-terminal domain-containing protein [Caulobacter sp.]|nr:ParB N-terminal domain-containing protein [Caulobacter sp.]